MLKGFAPRQVAVVLNDNARKVTPKIKAALEEYIPAEDIFYSSSPEDAASIVRLILHRKYPTVLTGGGDGTVIQLINDIVRIGHEGGQGDAMTLPAIGILPLGTGNALARLVSSGSFLCDIKNFVDNPTRDTHLLPLIEADGQKFPFAGLGWDAEILNDYKTVKAKYGETFLKPVLQNVGGYFASFFSKTIPRNISKFVRRKKIMATVVNEGTMAYRIGDDGTLIESFKKGDVIYEGPAGTVIVGTIPYYGYGMKVLPYAGKYQRLMHLRVATKGLFSAFMHLRSLWLGRSLPGLREYFAEKIKVTLDEPMPLQIGGDAQGYRDVMEFTVYSDAIRLIRFI